MFMLVYLIAVDTFLENKNKHIEVNVLSYEHLEEEGENEGEGNTPNTPNTAISTIPYIL